MMYPYSYQDVLAEHHKVVKDAETYRRYFRAAGPSRFTIGLLTFGARIARRFAVRLEHTVDSLRGREHSGTHTNAAA